MGGFSDPPRGRAAMFFAFLLLVSVASSPLRSTRATLQQERVSNVLAQAVSPGRYNQFDNARAGPGIDFADLAVQDIPSRAYITEDTNVKQAEITARGVAEIFFAAQMPDSTFLCQLDNEPKFTCTSPARFSDLVDGPHTFRVWSVDEVGGVEPSPAYIAWVVDHSPQTEIDTERTTAKNLVVSRERSHEFIFSAPQISNPTFECRLDGDSWKACVSPFKTSIEVQGMHEFTVRAIAPGGEKDANPPSVRWFSDVERPTPTPAITYTTTVQPVVVPVETSSIIATATVFETETESLLPYGAMTATTTSVPTTSTTVTIIEVESISEVVMFNPVLAEGKSATPTPKPGDDDTTTGSLVWRSEQSWKTDSVDQEADEREDNAGADDINESRGVNLAAQQLGQVAIGAVSDNGNWAAPVTEILSSTTAKEGAVMTLNHATFQFDAQGADATFECKLDDFAFSPCSSPRTYRGLADGEHTFQVQAIGPEGTVELSPKMRSWTIDTAESLTAFDAEACSVLDGMTVPNRSTTFVFAAPTVKGATFECKVDNTPFLPCSSPMTLPVTVGDHSFAVRTISEGDDVEVHPARISWTRDATYADEDDAPEEIAETPPHVPSPILERINADASIFNETHTRMNSAMFTFKARPSDNASEPVPGSFECSRDERTFEECASPVTLNKLKPGVHSFAIRLSGDASSEVRYIWTVNPNALETYLLSSSTAKQGLVSSSTNYTFFFRTVDPSATFECALDDESAYRICRSSHIVGGLKDGQHTFYVKVGGANVEESQPAELTWTVDTTPSNVHIDDSAAGAIRDGDTVATSSATFTFDAVGEANEFECFGDWMTSRERCSSPFVVQNLTDGNHIFEVYGKGPLGLFDSAPARRMWTSSTEPLETTLLPESSIKNGERTSSPKATFYFSASKVAHFKCVIDGIAAPCSSPTVLENLNDGPHTFMVSAIDVFGTLEQVPQSVGWVVDTTPPKTTIRALTSVKEGKVTASTTASFYFATTSVASFECKLDNEPFSACSSPKFIEGLSAGPHTMSIRTVDPLGNREEPPARRTWTVDTGVASTSFLPASTIRDGSVVPGRSASFSFAADYSAVMFECSLDGGDWKSCFSPVRYSNLDFGDHDFAVRSVDQLKNIDKTPSRCAWTIAEDYADSYEVELGKSSVVNGSRVASTSAYFEFATKTDDFVYECQLNGAGWYPCSSPIAYSGLEQGDNVWKVKTVDPAGFSGGSLVIVWNVAPSMSTTSITPDSTMHGHSWLASRDANIVFVSSKRLVSFQCMVDDETFEPCTSPFELTALPDGLHSVSVRSVDMLGNADTTGSVTVYWKVDTSIGPVRLDSSTVFAGGISSVRNAVFTFSTDDDGGFTTCEFDGEVQAVCQSPLAFDGLANGAHSLKLSRYLSGQLTDVAALNWTVDVDAAPVLFGPSSVEDGGVYAKQDAVIQFYDTSKAIGSFECMQDLAGVSTSWQPCTSPWQIQNLNEGEHMLHVRSSSLQETAITVHWSRLSSYKELARRSGITVDLPVAAKSDVAEDCGSGGSVSVIEGRLAGNTTAKTLATMLVRAFGVPAVTVEEPSETKASFKFSARVPSIPNSVHKSVFESEYTATLFGQWLTDSMGSSVVAHSNKITSTETTFTTPIEGFLMPASVLEGELSFRYRGSKVINSARLGADITGRLAKVMGYPSGAVAFDILRSQVFSASKLSSVRYVLTLTDPRALHVAGVAGSFSSTHSLPMGVRNSGPVSAYPSVCLNALLDAIDDEAWLSPSDPTSVPGTYVWASMGVASGAGENTVDKLESNNTVRAAVAESLRSSLGLTYLPSIATSAMTADSRGISEFEVSWFARKAEYAESYVRALNPETYSAASGALRNSSGDENAQVVFGSVLDSVPTFARAGGVVLKRVERLDGRMTTAAPLSSLVAAHTMSYSIANAIGLSPAQVSARAVRTDSAIDFSIYSPPFGMAPSWVKASLEHGLSNVSSVQMSAESTHESIQVINGSSDVDGAIAELSYEFRVLSTDGIILSGVDSRMASTKSRTSLQSKLAEMLGVHPAAVRVPFTGVNASLQGKLRIKAMAGPFTKASLPAILAKASSPAVHGRFAAIVNDVLGANVFIPSVGGVTDIAATTMNSASLESLVDSSHIDEASYNAESATAALDTSGVEIDIYFAGPDLNRLRSHSVLEAVEDALARGAGLGLDRVVAVSDSFDVGVQGVRTGVVRIRLTVGVGHEFDTLIGVATASTRAAIDSQLKLSGVELNAIAVQVVSIQAEGESFTSVYQLVNKTSIVAYFSVGGMPLDSVRLNPFLHRSFEAMIAKKMGVRKEDVLVDWASIGMHESGEFIDLRFQVDFLEETKGQSLLGTEGLSKDALNALAIGLDVSGEVLEGRITVAGPYILTSAPTTTKSLPLDESSAGVVPATVLTASFAVRGLQSTAELDSQANRLLSSSLAQALGGGATASVVGLTSVDEATGVMFALCDVIVEKDVTASAAMALSSYAARKAIGDKMSNYLGHNVEVTHSRLLGATRDVTVGGASPSKHLVDPAAVKIGFAFEKLPGNSLALATSRVQEALLVEVEGLSASDIRHIQVTETATGYHGDATLDTSALMVVSLPINDKVVIADALSKAARESVRAAVNGIVDMHSRIPSRAVTASVIAVQTADQVELEIDSTQRLVCSVVIEGGGVGKIAPIDVVDLLQASITNVDTPLVTEVLAAKKQSKTGTNVTAIYSMASSPSNIREALRICASVQARHGLAASISKISGLDLKIIQSRLMSVEVMETKNVSKQNLRTEGLFSKARIVLKLDGVSASRLRSSTAARARIAEVITSKAKPFVSRPATLDLSSVASVGASGSSIVVQIDGRDDAIAAAVQQLLLPDLIIALESTRPFGQDKHAPLTNVRFSVDLVDFEKVHGDVVESVVRNGTFVDVSFEVMGIGKTDVERGIESIVESVYARLQFSLLSMVKINRVAQESKTTVLVELTVTCPVADAIKVADALTTTGAADTIGSTIASVKSRSDAIPMLDASNVANVGVDASSITPRLIASPTIVGTAKTAVVFPKTPTSTAVGRILVPARLDNAEIADVSAPGIIELITDTLADLLGLPDAAVSFSEVVERTESVNFDLKIIALEHAIASTYAAATSPIFQSLASARVSELVGKDVMLSVYPAQSIVSTTSREPSLSSAGLSTSETTPAETLQRVHAVLQLSSCGPVLTKDVYARTTIGNTLQNVAKTSVANGTIYPLDIRVEDIRRRAGNSAAVDVMHAIDVSDVNTFVSQVTSQEAAKTITAALKSLNCTARVLGYSITSILDAPRNLQQREQRFLADVALDFASPIAANGAPLDISAATAVASILGLSSSSSLLNVGRPVLSSGSTNQVVATVEASSEKILNTLKTEEFYQVASASFATYSYLFGEAVLKGIRMGNISTVLASDPSVETRTDGSEITITPGLAIAVELNIETPAASMLGELPHTVTAVEHAVRAALAPESATIRFTSIAPGDLSTELRLVFSVVVPEAEAARVLRLLPSKQLHNAVATRLSEFVTGDSVPIRVISSQVREAFVTKVACASNCIEAKSWAINEAALGSDVAAEAAEIFVIFETIGLTRSALLQSTAFENELSNAVAGAIGVEREHVVYGGGTFAVESTDGLSQMLSIVVDDNDRTDIIRRLTTRHALRQVEISFFHATGKRIYVTSAVPVGVLPWHHLLNGNRTHSRIYDVKIGTSVGVSQKLAVSSSKRAELGDAIAGLIHIPEHRVKVGVHDGVIFARVSLSRTQLSSNVNGSLSSPAASNAISAILESFKTKYESDVFSGIDVSGPTEVVSMWEGKPVKGISASVMIMVQGVDTQEIGTNPVDLLEVLEVIATGSGVSRSDVEVLDIAKCLGGSCISCELFAPGSAAIGFFSAIQSSIFKQKVDAALKASFGESASLLNLKVLDSAMTSRTSINSEILDLTSYDGFQVRGLMQLRSNDPKALEASAHNPGGVVVALEGLTGLSLGPSAQIFSTYDGDFRTLEATFAVSVTLNEAIPLVSQLTSRHSLAVLESYLSSEVGSGTFINELSILSASPTLASPAARIADLINVTTVQIETVYRGIPIRTFMPKIIGSEMAEVLCDMFGARYCEFAPSALEGSLYPNVTQKGDVTSARQTIRLRSEHVADLMQHITGPAFLSKLNAVVESKLGEGVYVGGMRIVEASPVSTVLPRAMAFELPSRPTEDRTVSAYNCWQINGASTLDVRRNLQLRDALGTTLAVVMQVPRSTPGLKNQIVTTSASGSAEVCIDMMLHGNNVQLNRMLAITLAASTRVMVGQAISAVIGTALTVDSSIELVMPFPSVVEVNAREVDAYVFNGFVEADHDLVQAFTDDLEVRSAASVAVAKALGISGPDDVIIERSSAAGAGLDICAFFRNPKGLDEATYRSTFGSKEAMASLTVAIHSFESLRMSSVGDLTTLGSVHTKIEARSGGIQQPATIIRGLVEFSSSAGVDGSKTSSRLFVAGALEAALGLPPSSVTIVIPASGASMPETLDFEAIFDDSMLMSVVQKERVAAISMTRFLRNVMVIAPEGVVLGVKFVQSAPTTALTQPVSLTSAKIEQLESNVVDVTALLRITGTSVENVRSSKKLGELESRLCDKLGLLRGTLNIRQRDISFDESTRGVQMLIKLTVQGDMVSSVLRSLVTEQVANLVSDVLAGRSTANSMSGKLNKRVTAIQNLEQHDEGENVVTQAFIYQVTPGYSAARGAPVLLPSTKFAVAITLPFWVNAGHLAESPVLLLRLAQSISRELELEADATDISASDVSATENKIFAMINVPPTRSADIKTQLFQSAFTDALASELAFLTGTDVPTSSIEGNVVIASEESSQVINQPGMVWSSGYGVSGSITFSLDEGNQLRQGLDTDSEVAIWLTDFCTTANLKDVHGEVHDNRLKLSYWFMTPGSKLLENLELIDSTAPGHLASRLTEYASTSHVDVVATDIDNVVAIQFPHRKLYSAQDTGYALGITYKATFEFSLQNDVKIAPAASSMLTATMEQAIGATPGSVFVRSGSASEPSFLVDILFTADAAVIVSKVLSVATRKQVAKAVVLASDAFESPHAAVAAKLLLVNSVQGDVSLASAKNVLSSANDTIGFRGYVVLQTSLGDSVEQVASQVQERVLALVAKHLDVGAIGVRVSTSRKTEDTLSARFVVASTTARGPLVAASSLKPAVWASIREDICELMSAYGDSECTLLAGTLDEVVPVNAAVPVIEDLAAIIGETPNAISGEVIVQLAKKMTGEPLLIPARQNLLAQAAAAMSVPSSAVTFVREETSADAVVIRFEAPIDNAANVLRTWVTSRAGGNLAGIELTSPSDDASVSVASDKLSSVEIKHSTFATDSDEVDRVIVRGSFAVSASVGLSQADLASSLRARVSLGRKLCEIMELPPRATIIEASALSTTTDGAVRVVFEFGANADAADRAQSLLLQSATADSLDAELRAALPSIGDVRCSTPSIDEYVAVKGRSSPMADCHTIIQSTILAEVKLASGRSRGALPLSAHRVVQTAVAEILGIAEADVKVYETILATSAPHLSLVYEITVANGDLPSVIKAHSSPLLRERLTERIQEAIHSQAVSVDQVSIVDTSDVLTCEAASSFAQPMTLEEPTCSSRSASALAVSVQVIATGVTQWHASRVSVRSAVATGLANAIKVAFGSVSIPVRGIRPLSDDALALHADIVLPPADRLSGLRMLFTPTTREAVRVALGGSKRISIENIALLNSNEIDGTKERAVPADVYDVAIDVTGTSLRSLEQSAEMAALLPTAVALSLGCPLTRVVQFVAWGAPAAGVVGGKAMLSVSRHVDDMFELPQVIESGKIKADVANQFKTADGAIFAAARVDSVEVLGVANVVTRRPTNEESIDGSLVFFKSEVQNITLTAIAKHASSVERELAASLGLPSAAVMVDMANTEEARSRHVSCGVVRNDDLTMRTEEGCENVPDVVVAFQLSIVDYNLTTTLGTAMSQSFARSFGARLSDLFARNLAVASTEISDSARRPVTSRSVPSILSEGNLAHRRQMMAVANTEAGIGVRIQSKLSFTGLHASSLRRSLAARLALSTAIEQLVGVIHGSVDISASDVNSEGSKLVTVTVRFDVPFDREIDAMQIMSISAFSDACVPALSSTLGLEVKLVRVAVTNSFAVSLPEGTKQDATVIDGILTFSGLPNHELTVSVQNAIADTLATGFMVSRRQVKVHTEDDSYSFNHGSVLAYTVTVPNVLRREISKEYAASTALHDSVLATVASATYVSRNVSVASLVDEVTTQSKFVTLERPSIDGVVDARFVLYGMPLSSLSADLKSSVADASRTALADAMSLSTESIEVTGLSEGELYLSTEVSFLVTVPDGVLDRVVISISSYLTKTAVAYAVSLAVGHEVDAGVPQIVDVAKTVSESWSAKDSEDSTVPAPFSLVVDNSLDSKEAEVFAAVTVSIAGTDDELTANELYDVLKGSPIAASAIQAAIQLILPESLFHQVISSPADVSMDPTGYVTIAYRVRVHKNDAKQIVESLVTSRAQSIFRIKFSDYLKASTVVLHRCVVTGVKEAPLSMDTGTLTFATQVSATFMIHGLPLPTLKDPSSTAQVEGALAAVLGVPLNSLRIVNDGLTLVTGLDSVSVAYKIVLPSSSMRLAGALSKITSNMAAAKMELLLNRLAGTNTIVVEPGQVVELVPSTTYVSEAENSQTIRLVAEVIFDSPTIVDEIGYDNLKTRLSLATSLEESLGVRRGSIFISPNELHRASRGTGIRLVYSVLVPSRQISIALRMASSKTTCGDLEKTLSDLATRSLRDPITFSSCEPRVLDVTKNAVDFQNLDLSLLDAIAVDFSFRVGGMDLATKSTFRSAAFVKSVSSVVADALHVDSSHVVFPHNGLSFSEPTEDGNVTMSMSGIVGTDSSKLVTLVFSEDVLTKPLQSALATAVGVEGIVLSGLDIRRQLNTNLQLFTDSFKESIVNKSLSDVENTAVHVDLMFAAANNFGATVTWFDVAKAFESALSIQGVRVVVRESDSGSIAGHGDDALRVRDTVALEILVPNSKVTELFAAIESIAAHEKSMWDFLPSVESIEVVDVLALINADTALLPSILAATDNSTIEVTYRVSGACNSSAAEASMTTDVLTTVGKLINDVDAVQLRSARVSGDGSGFVTLIAVLDAGSVAHWPTLSSTGARNIVAHALSTACGAVVTVDSSTVDRRRARSDEDVVPLVSMPSVIEPIKTAPAMLMRGTLVIHGSELFNSVASERAVASVADAISFWFGLKPSPKIRSYYGLKRDSVTIDNAGVRRTVNDNTAIDYALLVDCLDKENIVEALSSTKTQDALRTWFGPSASSGPLSVDSSSYASLESTIGGLLDIPVAVPSVRSSVSVLVAGLAAETKAWLQTQDEGLSSVIADALCISHEFVKVADIQGEPSGEPGMYRVAFSVEIAGLKASAALESLSSVESAAAAHIIEALSNTVGTELILAETELRGVAAVNVEYETQAIESQIHIASPWSPSFVARNGAKVAKAVAATIASDARYVEVVAASPTARGTLLTIRVDSSSGTLSRDDMDLILLSSISGGSLADNMGKSGLYVTSVASTEEFAPALTLRHTVAGSSPNDAHSTYYVLSTLSLINVRMPSLLKVSECVADSIGLDRLRVKLARPNGTNNRTESFAKELDLEVRVDAYGYPSTAISGLLRKLRTNLDATVSQGSLVQCFNDADVTTQAVYTKTALPSVDDVTISAEGKIDACPAYSEWSLVQGVGSCNCVHGFEGNVATSIRKQTLTYLHVGSCSRVLADELDGSDAESCDALLGATSISASGDRCGCVPGQSASVHYDTVSGISTQFCRSNDLARSPVTIAVLDRNAKSQHTSVDVVANGTPVRITTRDGVNVIVES